MFKQTRAKNRKQSPYFLRGGLSLPLLFLLIEFFDELHYGIGNGALPIA